MCKGRQELELLGKHERGCLHGSHLIPAAAALWRRLPFIQVSCSLLGEFMVTKICLNCPSKSISPPPPPRGSRGSSGAQQDPRKWGDTQSAPGLLRRHTAHRHRGRSLRVVLGNEANGDFLHLGSLLGNCQLPLARKKCSRFAGFATRTCIAGHGNDAGPTCVVSIFIAFRIVIPICPSGLQVPEYFAV